MFEKCYSPHNDTIEGVQDPKSENNWDENYMKRGSLNCKAMYALFTS